MKGEKRRVLAKIDGEGIGIKEAEIVEKDNPSSNPSSCSPPHHSTKEKLPRCSSEVWESPRP